MAILVTGGAGFIGSNFVINWLMDSSETVINLDKLTYSGNLQNLNSLSDNDNHIFIQGDIGDSYLVGKILRKYNPRYIVNFAAESHVDRSIHSPIDFIKTNIVGTFQLLESARSYWSNLALEDKDSFRFLHVSTDEVYGSLKYGDPNFTEDNCYKPNSPYSASKASADHLVRAYFHTYDMPVLTTSCSNNYGPFQFPEKLIPLVICNSIKGKELPIYGSGKQIRDWLHVSDHCDAIRCVLEKGLTGEVYNIGGLNEKKNIEIVNTLCDLLDNKFPKKGGLSYKEQIVYVQDRAGHDFRYAIDASKIGRELGWSPKETFDTGIEKTVDWYLDNFEWVENLINGEYQKWITKNYT